MTEEIIIEQAITINASFGIPIEGATVQFFFRAFRTGMETSLPGAITNAQDGAVRCLVPHGHFNTLGYWSVWTEGSLPDGRELPPTFSATFKVVPRGAPMKEDQC